MQHSRDYLEHKYREPDPWGYQKSHKDRLRRAKILIACSAVSTGKPIGHRFARALDLGAGEGWIAKDLPAHEIHGYELSDRAAERFPPNVKRVLEPQGMYDLITATGIFYDHYDWRTMHGIVYAHATGIVVTCHIKEHEIPLDSGPETRREEFPYGDKTQVLRVYDFST